jgi:FlgN protein
VSGVLVQQDMLTHLGRQVESARRLLGIVLGQTAAIRERDVEGVLVKLAELQGELVHRGQLEQEREQLIKEAALRLGMAPADVDLDAMLTLDPQTDAQRARALSAELKGLVSETARVHDQNRLLVRQELSFLDHLMRVLSGAPQSGYSASGLSSSPQLTNAVNAHA